ncbi:hypothetical protein [Streptomyces tendae]
MPADAAQGVDVAHRRVEYLVPVPDSTAFYDILVELFDAVMSAFRWSYA